MLILRESPTIFLLSVVRLDCRDIVDSVTGLHRWRLDINPLFIWFRLSGYFRNRQFSHTLLLTSSTRIKDTLPVALQTKRIIEKKKSWVIQSTETKGNNSFEKTNSVDKSNLLLLSRPCTLFSFYKRNTLHILFWRQNHLVSGIALVPLYQLDAALQSAVSPTFPRLFSSWRVVLSPSCVLEGNRVPQWHLLLKNFLWLTTGWQYM